MERLRKEWIINVGVLRKHSIERIEALGLPLLLEEELIRTIEEAKKKKLERKKFNVTISKRRSLSISCDAAKAMSEEITSTETESGIYFYK